MDQTKTMIARPPRAHAGARGRSSLAVGSALLFVSSAAAAQPQSDGLKRLENGALEALADNRLTDASRGYRALYALSEDPRAACDVAEEISIDAGERRTVRLTLAAPRAADPPADPPEVAAPPKSAEPSVPSVAPPVSPVWPGVFMVSGVFVVLISIGIHGGALIASQPAIDAMESRIPFVSVNGCRGGEGYPKRCAEYWDAKQSADAAETTSATFLVVGITAGMTLMGAGYLGHWSTGERGRVQVVPTVGGVVVRGAF